MIFSNRVLWAFVAIGLILAVITLLADHSVNLGVLFGVAVFGTALLRRWIGRHDEE